MAQKFWAEDPGSSLRLGQRRDPGEATKERDCTSRRVGGARCASGPPGLRVLRWRPGGNGALGRWPRWWEAPNGMRLGRGLSDPDGPRRRGLRERRAAAAGPGRGAAGARAAGPCGAAGRSARPGPRPLARLPHPPPAATTTGGSSERAVEVWGAEGEVSLRPGVGLQARAPLPPERNRGLPKQLVLPGAPLLLREGAGHSVSRGKRRRVRRALSPEMPPSDAAV